MLEPIVLLWSGGKDSSLALQSLQDAGHYQVSALLTTMTAGFDRISIHGVRRSLLEAQAAALGLPLETVEIPQACSNVDYEAAMTEALCELSTSGVATAAAGDIFLADVRTYRERLVGRAGMKAEFPLWHGDSRELALSFIRSGFKATVSCVDTEALLSADFAGRAFDEQFLADLPATVDPCGENGEFHTFVHDGPIFRQPVELCSGEKVLRDGRFCYCDLLPTG